MQYLLSRKMHIISTTVFLIGLASFGLAYYSASFAKRPKSVQGFTMISRQSFTPNNGEKTILTGTHVRYQKQDGSWKLVNTYFKSDGTVRNTDSGFGAPDIGVFRVDEGKKQLDFLSSMEVAPQESELLMTHEQALRSDPRFIKEDEVMGYKTLVLRLPGQDESEFTDIYYAPVFRGIALKRVIVSKIGVETIEPLSIEVGEPDTAVFSSAPDYPVNYDKFNKKIETMEKMGNMEAAEGLRKQLNQQKSRSQN
jgi:hypothetical protein